MLSSRAVKENEMSSEREQHYGYKRIDEKSEIELFREFARNTGKTEF